MSLQSVDALSEQEIVLRFEEMLDDMNLSEEKKQPLRSRNIAFKKEMLRNAFKNDTFQNKRSRLINPSDFINHLSHANDISFSKLSSTMESLRIALTNNPLSWLKEFGLAGLKCILRVLATCYGNPNGQRAKLQHECIKCLKAFMNNTPGLRQVFGK